MKIRELIEESAKKMADASMQKEYTKVHRYRQELMAQIRHLPEQVYEIKEKLDIITKNPCYEFASLWLGAAEMLPSSEYMDALCELLAQENECIWHEGVIYTLRQLKDPRAIPALKQAIQHNLKYENTKQVAIRAMETLADIGTKEAIKIIEECLNHADELVREEAKLILNELDEE